LHHNPCSRAESSENLASAGCLVTFERLPTGQIRMFHRSTSSAVIEARELRKSYGSRIALDGVSFTVQAGEIVGLLGPNGAGKTTTLSILATILDPDSGNVLIGGLSSVAHRDIIRQKLGFVPQSIALYPSLSGLQNLKLFGRLHGIGKGEIRAACMAALDEVGLAERARDPVGVLSGGMKRRLNLACAIVHHPALWLLDEAAVGVDPQSREKILGTIRRAAAQGATIVYSSHYMEEVEQLCHRVLLIDHGRLVAEGTVAQITARAGGCPRMEIIFRQEPSPQWCSRNSGMKELTRTENGCKITVQIADLSQIHEVLEQARATSSQMVEFSVHNPNLSDAFLALTGHALRDTEPK
jgi:ABC-2 type transport system ATP-binding protein